MSKCNDDLTRIINPIIAEIINNSAMDNVKLDFIKEEIKNSSYQVNTRNIAKRILETYQKSRQEVTAE